MAPPIGLFQKFSLDATLGAVFIGTIAASISDRQLLQAVPNRQAHAQSTCYDLVVCVYNSLPTESTRVTRMPRILDLLHLIVIVIAMYHYAITSFGNLASLLGIHCTYQYLSASKRDSDLTTSSLPKAHVIFENLSDIIVRGPLNRILAHRIWKLSRGNVMVVSTIVREGAALRCQTHRESLSTAGSYNTFNFWIQATSLLDVGQYAVKVTIFGTLAMATVADLIMSATLCYFLRRHQSPFRKTQSFVDTIIISTINGGILTSVCALTCLVTYATMPDKFIYQAIYYVFSKLLLNSMLATLNARPSTRDSNMKGSYVEPFSPNTLSSETIGSKVILSVNKCDEEKIQVQPGQMASEETDPLPST
ncbi:hypothetical protein NLI96_g5724 [Meripilus lineatus]|uniref:DUF6534 domain-containing protein n=1 Tax=Meripilus lineatus TaxID=2056292 RepID=A0AAD5V316_9APHY|nr:hypothetical protein NLI96_g5724 [Physisporinus lineatus]